MLKTHPVQKIKHCKTTFNMENSPQTKFRHFRTTTKSREDTYIKMWTFPSQSSRTFAYQISQGHNGLWTEYKFKDIWIWNKQNTTVTEPIYKFKDIWIFNQQLISQCLCYTATHFYCQRSWDSFPTDHGGGTSRQLLHTVSSSHRSWDHFFPWPEEEAPTGFPRGLHAVQQQSHQQSASGNRPPWPPGSETKCRWNLYRWAFNQTNISYEHFHNDWNVTKQAS